MKLQIIRAENLAASDLNGLSDPFVKVLYDDVEMFQTKPVKCTVNPIWEEEYCQFPLTTKAPAYLILSVWDHDELTSNDYLGLCRVSFYQLSASQSQRMCCPLIQGPLCQGQVYIDITLDPHDVEVLSKSPFGTDIRDICPPHLPRFSDSYYYVPRKWLSSQQQSNGHNNVGKTSVDFIAPSNEYVLYTLEEVSLDIHLNEQNQGKLSRCILTNYRIWFVPYESPIDEAGLEDVYTISIGKIHQITLDSVNRGSVPILSIKNMDGGRFKATIQPLSFVNKTSSCQSLKMKIEAERLKVVKHIVQEVPYLKSQNNFFRLKKTNQWQSNLKTINIGDNFIKKSKQLISFSEATELSIHRKHKKPIIGRVNYDIVQEFERQGVLDAAGWRITNINATFHLCPTYPNICVVPASISDKTLLEASKFRSKGRIPALTWIHPISGAPLCRSSQPLTGIMGSENISDIDLIWAIKDCANNLRQDKHDTMVNIVDARPAISARGNAIAGKGYENVSTYDRNGFQCVDITFMGIENIHVVRSSFELLSDCLYEVEDSAFFGSVQKSKWLEHVASILNGARAVVGHLEVGEPVLVHCSDGWDRTAQLCALAQVMMDPYYRTIEGFAILIEKDWCSFGHKFKDRCAFPYSSETSPIFQQFLDAVYQLTLQFPVKFEFNELFLSTVCEAVYSSWFSTFQGNSLQDRNIILHDLDVLAIWDVIFGYKDIYVNPLYLQSQSIPQLPLLPSCNVRNLKLWCSQYQKAVRSMQIQRMEVEMMDSLHVLKEQNSLLKSLLSEEQWSKFQLLQIHSDIKHMTRAINLPNAPLVKSVPTRNDDRTCVQSLKKEKKLDSYLYNANASLRYLIEAEVECISMAKDSIISEYDEEKIDILESPKDANKYQLNGHEIVNTSKNDQVKTARGLLDVIEVVNNIEKSTRKKNYDIRYFNYQMEANSVDEEDNYFSVRTDAIRKSLTELITHSNHASCTLDASNQKETKKPVWIPNREAISCRRCKRKFRLFRRRRHHCRKCGNIFCSACSSNSKTIPTMGYSTPVRICTGCYKSK